LLLQSGTAGFTCARVWVIFGRPRIMPGFPTAPAFYPVSVRQFRSWPRASSPLRITTKRLPSTRGSHHQGPQGTSTFSINAINAMPGTHEKARHCRAGPRFP